MKHVVFFIGSLQSGGTEAKLARNFLPVLKKRGRINPKLLLLQEKGQFLHMLPEDPDAIADALIQVLSDEKLRENLSRLSLERADDFDIEESLTQWEEIVLGKYLENGKNKSPLFHLVP